MHGAIEPHVQTTLLTKAGDPRTIYWASMLLHDPDGTLTGTLNLGADMTGQIEAESVIRRYRSSSCRP
jgi:hypothetical protein